MSQNMAAFAVIAAVAGVGAKAVALPTAFSALLAFAVFGCCMVVSNFLKMEVPKVAPKPKKMSKSEKRAKVAAAAPKKDEEPAEDTAKLAKAAKRREKERAKKEAKKAAEEERKAAEAAEAAELEAAKAAMTKAEKKKKKKKGAKKAATVAPTTAAAPEEVEKVEKVEKVAATKQEPVESGDWAEVKGKKGKMKKVEDPSAAIAPAFTLDLYVEKKYFGLIIGEKGSTLNAIQEATGTEIDLPKDGGIRREIIISGEVEGCKQAQTAIKQLVAKGYSSLTHANTIDSEIKVPDKKRALLIGPGGKNIKAIQEKTGCKINLPDKGGDSDIVSIVGDSSSVKQAMEAIKQLIDQGYSDITHENFVKADVEVARDMLRTLIGPGGATIRALQDSTRTRINVPSDKDGATIFVTLLGEAADVEEAKAQIGLLLVAPEPVPIADEWQKEASLVHMQW